MTTTTPSAADAIDAQEARNYRMEELYHQDGRHEPGHPMRGLYTGLVMTTSTINTTLINAELLVQKQEPAPVPASERPWEREGWLHPRGLWCWRWRPDSVSWQMTTCKFCVAQSDDSLFLPYWAIIDPDSSEAS